MKLTTEVVVIGAGPYGLSIAAHLRRRGVDFRIFGKPMQNWRTAMPKGMFLKSEGNGSSLSDPDQTMSLAHHCALNGLPYHDTGIPIALETFVEYGLAFQQRLVPEVEEHTVVALAGKSGAFELQLDTGERVTARRVVIAVGTTYFGQLPSQLATLPRELVSHSREHCDLAKFAQREVVVIGGGASALETAALLNEEGAAVRLLVRAPRIVIGEFPRQDTVLRRLRHPPSGMGPGWKPWFYCHGQQILQHFPQHVRSTIVRDTFGPAAAWWLKDRVVGRFPVQCGHVVREAREKGGKACLSVADRNGQMSDVWADHVIAATGYKVDIGSLPFLDADLSHRLRRVDTSPALSASFESSVSGLYFTGLFSANRFGPSMRFVVGADYTARRIASALRPGRIQCKGSLASRKAAAQMTPIG